MKAIYTEKFKQAILSEIDKYEKTKDNSCLNLLFRIPAPFTFRKTTDFIDNAKQKLDDGFLEGCVFSKKDNGNWMCDDYVGYGYPMYTKFFEWGYLQVVDDFANEFNAEKARELTKLKNDSIGEITRSVLESIKDAATRGNNELIYSRGDDGIPCNVFNELKNKGFDVDVLSTCRVNSIFIYRTLCIKW